MRSEFVALILTLTSGIAVTLTPAGDVAVGRHPAPSACRWVPAPGMTIFPLRTGTMSPDAKTAEIRTPPENGKALENYCEKLLNVRRSIYYLNTRSYKMSLQLRGIYTREEAIFFCLRLYNHSHIDYGVDSIRFCTADEKQLRKIPVEGKAMVPIYSCGNARLIRGKTGELCVFALPRFTLPGRKRLVIEVLEKNGGRHLRLLTDNYTLVKARLI
jgi:hypothetical protein